MFNTLRNRLLASYVTVIVITLGFISLALLVFLRSRPLPTDEIVRDLTATLLDVRVAETWQIEPGTLEWDPENVPSLATVELRITTYLATQASARDVRTLVIDGQQQVRFDSATMFAENQLLNETDRQPIIPASATGRMVSEVFEGRFENPDGSEWIFVAQPLLRPLWSQMFQEMMGQQRLRDPIAPDPNLFLMVAAPVPVPTLREVFHQFGDEILRPLARAGILGLLIALGLSVLIARSVARPLLHMSRAAQRLAQGDFEQRVPVNGPYEVRALAQSFNEMVARVAVTQQAQRDFLANVSHDLRTPLTSIQGFSQAIAEGVTSDPESARHAAQVIHDEAGRLHRMVEDLLDLARIEAGRWDMLRHTVGVGDITRAIGESLSVKARENGVRLEIDIPADLPRIAGDGDRLAQVFTNLIENAIKHTPSGGMVGLRAEVAPNGLAVSVRDTGEGIPPEDLPRIFERFYQVDKSRQRRRTSSMGLGLAITKQIVETHGGRIHVASAVGEGTVFTVWLPLPTPDMTTVIARRGM